MLKLKKVAITGGISSGKTTVCHLLKEHGAYHVNSDIIVRQLLNHPSCIQRTVQLLGSEILTDGKIDRGKVADSVFTCKEKLKALEKILHPLLFEKIEEEYERANRENKYSFFVVEIPLIQEIGKAKEFDVIVAIVCDEKTCQKRWKESGFSTKSYQMRMKRQWPIDKKAEYADFVLTNNGSYRELEKQVLKLVAFLNTL